MSGATAGAAAPDLDHIRARLFEVRWLTADGVARQGCTPAAPIAVSGAARAVLAHLIGTDTPALITALEQQTARAERAETRVAGYENATAWTTTCVGCANGADRIRRAEELVEQAEKALNAMEDTASHWMARHHAATEELAALRTATTQRASIR